MSWTPITAAFFCVIAGLLIVMTIAEILKPSRERKGFLPIITTRGDRLFIALLSSAFLHLAWLGLTSLPLVWMTGLCVVWMLGLLRFG
jgi:predicted small integral membrane protein